MQLNFIRVELKLKLLLLESRYHAAYQYIICFFQRTIAENYFKQKIRAVTIYIHTLQTTMKKTISNGFR